MPATGSGPPFELKLALRYLVTRRPEGPVALVTLLCTAGVAVGVAALVLALSLMNGLQDDLRERLLASNPHVVVRPGWGQPAYTNEDAETVTRLALAEPGVIAAAPFRAEFGLLRGGSARDGRPVNVKAVDPVQEDRVTGLRSQTTAIAWERLLADDRGAKEADVRLKVEAGDESDQADDEPMDLAALAVDEPPVVLLGETLALELGVSAGDLVHLTVGVPELSALGPVPRSRALRVGGLLRTGLHEYDQSWGIVSLARQGAGVAIGGVQLALERPMDSPLLAEKLAERLGPSHAVADWTTTFARLFAAFKWERLIMFLALGLISLVAGFNIFTILSMNVMARVADIGILGAMGARSGSILKLFSAMGLGLGGAGTVAGLGLGCLAAKVLDHYRLVALDPAVYLVSHVPFRVDALDLAIVAGGMLVVTLFATVLPSRAAARLDPVVALRAAG